MTEEEKNAIHELKCLYVNSENITLEQKFAIETALNLIRKQQEEIEKNMNFINYLQLQDVEKLGQIIKKDKMIAEMAREIHILSYDSIKYCDNKNNGDCEIAHCKDCIIEFFEKKVGEKITKK